MPFPKGKSGNPGGRPKADVPVKALARENTIPAMATLVAALSAKESRTRVAAAEAILDRGWGRPSQHIELDAGDDLVRRMNDAAKRIHTAEKKSKGFNAARRYAAGGRTPGRRSQQGDA